MIFSVKFFNTLEDDSCIIDQVYKLVATANCHLNIAKTVASPTFVTFCSFRPVVFVNFSER